MTTKTLNADQAINLLRTTRDPKVVRRYREDPRVTVRQAAWRRGLNQATPKASFARHAADSDPEVRLLTIRAAMAAKVRLPYAAILSAISGEDDKIAIAAINAVQYKVGGYPAHLHTFLCHIAEGGDDRASAAASVLWEDDLLRIAVANPTSAVWDVITDEVIDKIWGPTEFVGLYGTSFLHRSDKAVVDGDALVVLHVEGWQKYGRRPARYRAASYLGGLSGDDTGYWAVRVPSSVNAIWEALDAITPAEVKHAQDRGKKVLRQGDLYAVETTKAHDTSSCQIGRHEWDQDKRVLSHPEHAPLEVPFPARFFVQRGLPMRGTGVVYGD